ncbi:MAG: replication-relaxation family protein [Mycobacteriales bacterium]
MGKPRRLRHLVGVTGFFSALVAESRRREDCDLLRWWSERHRGSQLDRIAQPGGLGVWEEAGTRVVFCLETGARRVLAQPTVPVATGALEPTQRPHEAIWASMGDEGARLRLAELAAAPISRESEERIAETQAHRRRAVEQSSSSITCRARHVVTHWKGQSAPGRPKGEGATRGSAVPGRAETSGSCPTPICPRVRGQAMPVVLQAELMSMCCARRAGSSTRGVRAAGASQCSGLDAIADVHDAVVEPALVE